MIGKLLTSEMIHYCGTYCDCANDLPCCAEKNVFPLQFVVGTQHARTKIGFFRIPLSASPLESAQLQFSQTPPEGFGVRALHNLQSNSLQSIGNTTQLEDLLSLGGSTLGMSPKVDLLSDLAQALQQTGRDSLVVALGLRGDLNASIGSAVNGTFVFTLPTVQTTVDNTQTDKALEWWEILLIALGALIGIILLSLCILRVCFARTVEIDMVPAAPARADPIRSEHRRIPQSRSDIAPSTTREKTFDL